MDSTWRKFQAIISELGFEGKGKTERFIKKLCVCKFIFLEGSGKISISVD